MKRYLFSVTCVCLLFFISCHQGTGTTKVSATGSIYELLVVMPDILLTDSQRASLGSYNLYDNGSAYDEPVVSAYDVVRATMEAPMPCLPQFESYFKLSHVTLNAFDDFLKPTRNILIVDIDPKYADVKLKYRVDPYAHPQMLYKVQAPHVDAFIAYWHDHGTELRDKLVRSEIDRQTRFYRASTNKDFRHALQRNLNIDMLVPEDYQLLMDTVERRAGQDTPDLTFFWLCNNKGTLRRDLVIYAYPYTEEDTFTPQFLNMKRDEVLSRFISASVPGSYMGTEYKVFPPVMQWLTVDSTTVAEVRGLWKIYNGEAMGGPYVSHSRVSADGRQVITAEVYVLAPGEKKRAALRQAEAILYSLHNL